MCRRDLNIEHTNFDQLKSWLGNKLIKHHWEEKLAITFKLVKTNV